MNIIKWMNEQYSTDWREDRKIGAVSCLARRMGKSRQAIQQYLRTERASPNSYEIRDNRLYFIHDLGAIEAKE